MGAEVGQHSVLGDLEFRPATGAEAGGKWARTVQSLVGGA